MAESKTVEFHYLKSNQFRTVHADGAWGGRTPSDQFLMMFYTERVPIPQRVDLQVSEGGVIGEQVARVGRNGIVREAEVAAVMTLEVAKRVHDWLGKQIDGMEKARKAEVAT